MKPSDIVDFGVGVVVGDSVTDALEMEGLEKLIVGVAVGTIGASVIGGILKETGVSGVVDDIFGDFF